MRTKSFLQFFYWNIFTKYSSCIFFKFWRAKMSLQTFVWNIFGRQKIFFWKIFRGQKFGCKFFKKNSGGQKFLVCKFFFKALEAKIAPIIFQKKEFAIYHFLSPPIFFLFKYFRNNFQRKLHKKFFVLQNFFKTKTGGQYDNLRRYLQLSQCFCLWQVNI